MKKYIRDYVILFTFAGIVVGLDQATKIWVRTNLDFQEFWAPWDWILPYARIVHWKNTGAAFGMFQNMNTVFMILAIIVSGVIIYYFPRIPRSEWYLRLALCLQFSGAVGNLIDRIHQGYVTDFVSVGTFAVFNVADACISMGVVVMLAGLWIKERQAKTEAGQMASGKTQTEAQLEAETPQAEEHPIE